MDESKITEIIQWPAPRNEHKTHMFLSLCGYYRRYVKDFVAHVSHELTHELSKVDVAFMWDGQWQ